MINALIYCKFFPLHNSRMPILPFSKLDVSNLVLDLVHNYRRRRIQFSYSNFHVLRKFLAHFALTFYHIAYVNLIHSKLYHIGIYPLSMVVKIGYIFSYFIVHYVRTLNSNSFSDRKRVNGREIFYGHIRCSGHIQTTMNENNAS